MKLHHNRWGNEKLSADEFGSTIRTCNVFPIASEQRRAVFELAYGEIEAERVLRLPANVAEYATRIPIWTSR